MLSRVVSRLGTHRPTQLAVLRDYITAWRDAGVSKLQKLGLMAPFEPIIFAFHVHNLAWWMIGTSSSSDSQSAGESTWPVTVHPGSPAAHYQEVLWLPCYLS
jgi:hypothetical protein